MAKGLAAMHQTMLRISEEAPELPHGPWILILGGVSRLGNRRARRFVARAVEIGNYVVWLDGFEETLEDSNERVDLPTMTSGSVVVVGYRTEERKFILNQIADFVPRLVFAPGSWVAGCLGRSKHESVAHMGRRIRRVTRRIGEALRSKFLGKVAAAFRGRAGYRIVRAQLHQLARSSNPSAIVYCDDFALTIAWHAAKIWDGVPVSAELPD